MSDHPSRLVLERASVDDLPAAEQREVRSHLEGCETCAAYLRELDGEKTKLPAEAPFLRAVAARRERPRANVFYILGAGLALAAALVLVLRRPDAGGIGLKGGGLSVQRSRNGDVRAIGVGDTIRAGDALRLVVTLPHAASVDVWFVDASGHRDAFAKALGLPAGESVLPGSARVDAPCKDLTITLKAGDAPEVVSQLRCE